MLNLSKLKQAALAATKGHWLSTGVVVAAPSEGGMEYLVECCDGGSDHPNLEYIAEACPEVILELLQLLEKQKAALAANSVQAQEPFAWALEHGSRAGIKRGSVNPWVGSVEAFPLYRTPVQPVAVPEDVAKLKHERDTLAQGIADAALKAGIWNGEVPLSGPHLLMMVNDMAECIASPTTSVVAVPGGWRLVPIVPTPKMVDSTFNDDMSGLSHNRRNKDIWAAMIAACPAAPAAQGDAKDAERLEFIENSTVDLRCHSAPTGGDDSDIYWNVIEHHMAEPNEREIGWGNTARQAIDAAIAAKAAS